MEHIEILAAVGNKLGNDFWEANLPSYFKRPDISTSLEEVFEVVKNKYVKALYAPKDRINPVKEFLEAKKDGQTTAGSFNQAKMGQNSKPREVTKDTPTTTTTKPVEKKVPTQHHNLMDFEEENDFGEFKSAPEKTVKVDIPKPDFEVKFVSNNGTTQKSGVDLWGASFEPKSSNVHLQKTRSTDPFSFEQPQNPLPTLTQKSNSASTDSSKLYELYKTGNPEQQNTTKPISGTNFAGGQSNYAFLDGFGSQQTQQNRFGQQQQQPFGFQNGMNGQSTNTQYYGGMQSQTGSFGGQTGMSKPTGGFDFGGSNNTFNSNGFGGATNGGFGSSGFNSVGNSGTNAGFAKPQQQQPFSFNQPTNTAPFSFNNTSQPVSQPSTVKTGFSFF